jgi:hypothetical protein
VLKVGTIFNKLRTLFKKRIVNSCIRQLLRTTLFNLFSFLFLSFLRSFLGFCYWTYILVINKQLVKEIARMIRIRFHLIEFRSWILSRPIIVIILYKLIRKSHRLLCHFWKFCIFLILLLLFSKLLFCSTSYSTFIYTNRKLLLLLIFLMTL